MIKLRYGNTNTYFTDGLLIDTDLPGTLPLFYKELKRNGLTVQDIRYVLATHYHPDHMGLISELTALGTRLILVDRQVPYVHFADPIFARRPELHYRPIREEDAIIITCAESRQFLSGIGIGGEIISTESHSPDGITLITDDGFCFVGDLEPQSYLAAYGDHPALQSDWDAVMSRHPTVIFSGHINDRKI